MTTTTSTTPAAAPETRAQRLERLLVKFLPNDAKRIKSGEWGKAGPPYRFSTKDDGRQHLVVIDPETESSKGFVGKDRDDLLNQFEAWLPK